MTAVRATAGCLILQILRLSPWLSLFAVPIRPPAIEARI